MLPSYGRNYLPLLLLLTALLTGCQSERVAFQMQSVFGPKLVDSAMNLPQLNNTTALGIGSQKISFSVSDTLKSYPKTDGSLSLRKRKNPLLRQSRPANALTTGPGKMWVRSTRAIHPQAAITDSDYNYGTLILCFFGVCLGLLLLLISLFSSSLVLALVGLGISLGSFFYALIAT